MFMMIGMAFRDFIINVVDKIFSFFHYILIWINIKWSLWNDPLRCYYCGRHARYLEGFESYFAKQFCKFPEQCNITNTPNCKGHTRRLCSYMRHLEEREKELITNTRQMEREGLSNINSPVKA
jgi:hypothetical protein